ncbi:DUF924 family protein [Candidatus Protochlamydia phocaeensis]|uniref:DUF924 family protein n=1 Tax=Candidatus Protochlamydia phocaeensis TaxID=1414722 RepID=UPI000837DBD5|nr:DUF924 family protein [Candidatus Protochlamydia phocaeensis]
MKIKVSCSLFQGIMLGLLPYTAFAQLQHPSLNAPPVPIGSDAAREPLAPAGRAAPAEHMVVERTVPERAQQILDFWFGPLSGPDSYPTDKVSIWLANSPDIDRQIREEFAFDVQNAINGDLNSWRDTPKGRLALILLLDDFSRIIYRNTPQAFASDAMAKGLVLEGIQRGDDKKLYPIERAFFYLPLEHSEDPKLQALSVNVYKQLFEQAPDKIKSQMQQFYQYALFNQQVISRFGRFPHRNAILGRTSTPEEIIYLNQRGSFTAF